MMVESDGTADATRRLNIKKQTLDDAYAVPANFLEIDVVNPMTTMTAGKKRYTDYEVKMKTNLPVFKIKESSVRRRYSDFEWLRNELERDSKNRYPLHKIRWPLYDGEIELCTDLIAKSVAGGIEYMGYKYHKSGVVKNGVVYYRCAKLRSLHCPASLQIQGDCYRINKKEHNHSPKTKADALAGKKLEYNGYYFYRHGKTINKIHWRCSTLACSVRLHTDLSGNFVCIRGEHKH